MSDMYAIEVMRRGWRVLVVVVCVVSFLCTVVPVYAHIGSVAPDGCHYCWTNCDQYGVEYGERHCHNGNEAVCTPARAQHESWLRNLLTTRGGIYYLTTIIAQVAMERERAGNRE